MKRPVQILRSVARRLRPKLAEPPAVQQLSVESAGYDASALFELVGVRVEDMAVFPAPVIYNLIRHAVNQKQSPDDFLLALAQTLTSAGQPDPAIRIYRNILARKPDTNTHSMLLQALLFSPNTTNETYYAEAREWARRWIGPAEGTRKLPNTPDPTRRLRVGYACHFFHNSVSTTLLQPFLRAHDRSQVEIFCYSDAPATDVPDELRTIADHWRDIPGISDDAFEQLILKDEIDVLLEMNGHCFLNRYAALSRRLAPVQINFYNHAATCGVPEVDYTLIDTKIIPKEEERFFTETVYRLPNSYGASVFGDMFPPVSPPPCLKNGYITFGSFGASHKVTEPTLDLWCAALHAVPGSKMFMKAGALTHEAYRDVYYGYFEKRGIGRERLVFEGWDEHADMLKRYRSIDIALDTIPHNGGTTTLEALWMGVPVVSLSGDRVCSRSGKSVLTNLGRAEWIAYTPEEFTAIARTLAADTQKLATLRAEQREQMRKSVLCDARLYAKDLEDAYRFMWKRWCETQAERTPHALSA